MHNKSEGYNNIAFSINSRNNRETSFQNNNNRLEVRSFQAFNNTFVDDNGESYVDFQQDCYEPPPTSATPNYRFARRTIGGKLFEYTTQPKCRRSIVLPVRREPSEYTVGYHRERFESIESENEEYVDSPEDIERYRESPVGSSIGTTRCSYSVTDGGSSSVTPLSSPRKTSLPTTPSGRTIDHRNSIILAPMIAQMEQRQNQQQQLQQSIHRSRSTLITSPTRPIVVRRDFVYLSPSHSNKSPSQFGNSLPSLVSVKHYNPTILSSFNHIMESEVMDAQPNQFKTPNRRPNTAVITPNLRASTTPLLQPTTPTKSPQKLSQPSTPQSPSNFSKTSRASWSSSLPNIHMPTELLCCIGFFLLTSGAGSCILCFYILALGVGNKYFINFGAVGGFTALTLGFLSFRTNRWKWLPHRNYLTGYSLLSAFSVLNAACLSGICYAIETQSVSLLDILGGAVCGLSIIVTLGTIIGLVTSGCCHRPPPDNRVANCVDGFSV